MTNGYVECVKYGIDGGGRVQVFEVMDGEIVSVHKEGLGEETVGEKTDGGGYLIE